MIEKNTGDFQRISNLLHQIQDQLSYDRIKELISSALAKDNRDALGALGHFNLNQALKAAQQIGGNEGQEPVASRASHRGRESPEGQA